MMLGILERQRSKDCQSGLRAFTETRCHFAAITHFLCDRGVALKKPAVWAVSGGGTFLPVRRSF